MTSHKPKLTQQNPKESAVRLLHLFLRREFPEILSQKVCKRRRFFNSEALRKIDGEVAELYDIGGKARGRGISIPGNIRKPRSG